MDITYRQLHRQEFGWIASHVAGDLLNMNDPNDRVTLLDWGKILDARARDAAIATLPRESANLVPTRRRR